ncbi:MAG: FadR/GntR family transcriptional regulator [Pseudomonadota bacterium]
MPTIPKLQVIQVVKPSEMLASQLREHILHGTLKDGAPLPAERDLVEQTGVSRGSVREALRILQAEGFIETRPGRFGGSVVRKPGDDALAKYLGLFIQGRSISLMALLQVREVMGGPIASLAAMNRTDEDLAKLEEIGKRMEASLADLPVYLAENVKWHVAIASATHNELLEAFITAISSLVFKATATENFASEDVQKVVIKAHKRILEAIINRDPETASRRMSRHLATITKDLQNFASAPAILR